jgi:hypothetical protein
MDISYLNNNRKMPVGIQTFEKIVEGGYLYVDKTDLMFKLANGPSQFIFLSRPRRFGKSLLISTLKSYFLGQKELFKGLAVEGLERDKEGDAWAEHPVFHFDFTGANYARTHAVNEKLNFILSRYEEIYGEVKGASEPADKFSALIENAHKQTGKEVVALIDEYDKPLLQRFEAGEEESAEIKADMKAFYGVLKAAARNHDRFDVRVLVFLARQALRKRKNRLLTTYYIEGNVVLARQASVEILSRRDNYLAVL